MTFVTEPRTSLNRIGIMQGRLTPPLDGRFQCFPRDAWADEFPRAAECGLACIEWIYDAFGADANPLTSSPGIARMKELAAGTAWSWSRSARITSWTGR